MLLVRVLCAAAPVDGNWLRRACPTAAATTAAAAAIAAAAAAAAAVAAAAAGRSWHE